MSAVLRVAGLTKTVGTGRARRRVLEEVTLDVEAGEIVAVLGRSGSGKSTLLNLLGGLDRPDGGEIEIAGQPLTGLRGSGLARLRLRHIGFVFQQFQLIEECSGLENVLMPTRLPGAPKGGGARAAALVAELGVQSVADHLPHELSGGEQQRFALARALVNDPELVLADEPTGSLDSENGAAVLELLRSLGRTVVMVTHEPEAAAVADRVMHLRDGRLVDAAVSAAPLVTGAERMRGLRGAFAEARRELAPRRRHALLSALGIALAAAMLSAAIVVADGLGLGFSRSARAADLPDLIVRFDPEPQATVDQRIRALPDVAGYATRTEMTNVSIAAAGHHATGDAVAELVGSGRRRGYAVVAGHDLAPTGNQILVEKAFADSWGLHPGSIAFLRGLGPERVVGLVEAPDNVGFPLAKPRFYLARSALEARFGPRANPKVNYAEVWLRNPRYLDEVLVQARASSFGLRGLQFATRSGVKILHDQAAGIVIDLLVALSLIALATAGAMLAASARAEVQRRLRTIGVQRAVGASSGHVTLVHALQAMLVAAPAAAVGCLAGALAVSGPSDRLLTLLNEPSPGAALIGPLLAGWAAAVLVAVGGAAWPAWRAASGPVASLLRGADVTGGRGRLVGRRLAQLRSRVGAGPAVLGARLVLARRTRLLATVATLGLSAAFVLLMLSLASELSALQADPGVLGERYQLTATLPPAEAARVARIPGVQAVAPRYELEAVDSFSLGETIDVIAYPGNHTTFEAPPLSAGRRLRGTHQTEIGEGLAEALGLSPGQTLALELPTGKELRLRVSGVVNSLEHDGRIAYVPAAALLRADPGAPSTLAVRLQPGADATRVADALDALGGATATASGATARGASLVAVLRAIVTAVAIVDGLVCLYALLQACALTVQERRRALAVLRACGAGTGAVRRLLAGAALCMLVPSVIAGVLLERLVLGPALSRLAENYVTLPLQASALEVALTAVGLLLAGGVAVLWVARQAGRESVVRELSA